MGSQESECQHTMVAKEHEVNNDNNEKKINVTTDTTTGSIPTAESLGSRDKDNCVLCSEGERIKSSDAPKEDQTKARASRCRCSDKSKSGRKSRRKKRSSPEKTSAETAEPKRANKSTPEEATKKSTAPREKESGPRKPRKQRSSRGLLEGEEDDNPRNKSSDEERPEGDGDSDEHLGDNSAALTGIGRMRRLKSASLAEEAPKPSSAHLRRTATTADRVSRKPRAKPASMEEKETETASKPAATTAGRVSRKSRIQAAPVEEDKEEAPIPSKPAAAPLQKAATTTGRISRKSRMKAPSAEEGKDEEEAATFPLKPVAAPLQRAATAAGRVSRKSRIKAQPGEEDTKTPSQPLANPLRRAATSTGMAARRPLRRAFSNKESVAAMARRPLQRASTNEDDIAAMARSARSFRSRRANSGKETPARQRSARSLFRMEGGEEEEEDPAKAAPAPFQRAATSTGITPRTLPNRWGEVAAVSGKPEAAPFRRANTNSNIASSRLRNKLAMLKEEAASSAASKQSWETKSLASFGDHTAASTTRRRLGGRASSDKELSVNSLMAPGGAPRRASSNKDLVAMARLAGSLAGTDNVDRTKEKSTRKTPMRSSSSGSILESALSKVPWGRPSSRRQLSNLDPGDAGESLASKISAQTWVANLKEDSQGTVATDSISTDLKSEDNSLAAMLVSETKQVTREDGTMSVVSDSLAVGSRKSQPIRASSRRLLCDHSSENQNNSLEQKIASGTKKGRREDGTRSVVSESFATESRKLHASRESSRRKLSDHSSGNEKNGLDKKLASRIRQTRREGGTRSVVSESLVTERRKSQAVRASSRRQLSDHSSGNENNNLDIKLASGTKQTRREDGSRSVVSESLAAGTREPNPVQACSRRQLSDVSSGNENNTLEKKLATGTRHTKSKDGTRSVVSESFATESRKSRPARASSRRQLSDLSTGNENNSLQKKLAAGTGGVKRDDGRRSVVSESLATSRKSRHARASSRRQLSDLSSGNEKRASSRRQLSDLSSGNENKTSAFSQNKDSSAAGTNRRKRPSRAASESILFSSGIDSKAKEGKIPSKSRAKELLDPKARVGRETSSKSPMRDSTRSSARHLNRARSSGQLLDENTAKASRPGRNLRRSPSAGHVLDDKRPGRRRKAPLSPLRNGRTQRSSSCGSLTLMSDSSGEEEAGDRKKLVKLKRVRSAGQDLFGDARAPRSSSLSLLSDSDEEDNGGRKKKRGLRRAQSTGTDLLDDASRADKQHQVRIQGRKHRPKEGRRHGRRHKANKSPMRASTCQLSSNRNKPASTVKPRVARRGNRQRKTQTEQLISSIDESTSTADVGNSMDDSNNVWHHSDPMLGDWDTGDPDSEDENGQDYLPGMLGAKKTISAPNFLDSSISGSEGGSKSGRRGSTLWKAAQTSAQRILDWPTPKVSKDKLTGTAKDGAEGGMEGSFRAPFLGVSNAFGTMLTTRNERRSSKPTEGKGKQNTQTPNDVNWFKEQVEVSMLRELEVQSRLPMGNAPPAC